MAGSEASAAFVEGVPCWIDAQLPDVEAGKRFYGELFGWTFEPFDKAEEPGPSPASAAYATPGVYAGSVRARLDAEPVAALVPKRDGRMPTVWTVYFATPDAYGLADRIRKAGGQVITAPVPVGPYATVGLAADPEGAVFGLWEGGTHPGFARRHGPGSFGWVELYARDTAVADSFYSGLFHDALFGPGVRRDFGRAHIGDVFLAEMPPHFLVHFGVADCETVLGAVVRLGGRVQAPPFDTSYGRVAVVSDNQGASFALLQT